MILSSLTFLSPDVCVTQDSRLCFQLAQRSKNLANVKMELATTKQKNQAMDEQVTIFLYLTVATDSLHAH